MSETGGMDTFDITTSSAQDFVVFQSGSHSGTRSAVLGERKRLIEAISYRHTGNNFIL